MQRTQRTTDGVGGQETLPLVVMGEQGIGKSSALAMLAQQSRQHEDVLVIVRPMTHAWLCLWTLSWLRGVLDQAHFVGCTDESVFVRHLLVRITLEMTDLLNMPPITIDASQEYDSVKVRALCHTLSLWCTSTSTLDEMYCRTCSSLC